MGRSSPYNLKSSKKSAKALELSRNFAAISREPLRRQDSSDAWNERQNKLAAARTAVSLMNRAAKLRGRGE